MTSGFTHYQMFSDYLKLSRLFNMGLTGVAPVLGALSMWNVGETPLLNLVVLFLMGCFSHIYGFALNDVIDIKIDKLSKELTARPLVRGAIAQKKAASFAITSMIIAFLLSLFFFTDLMDFLQLIAILVVAYILATLYDFTSKKYPGMDVFVASAVFCLIVFGAATVSYTNLLTTPIVWIVALIGGIQVLFMNMINGAIKDIDHDAKGMANTFAIRLGAGVKKNVVVLPLSFKTIGYLIEATRSFLIFVPFIFLSDMFPLQLWQITLLIVLTILTFYAIHSLFSIQQFQRDRLRKHIGIIVIFMYATTPVMLSSLNLYIGLVAFVPPVWFFLSNIVLHKTVFEPKTM